MRIADFIATGAGPMTSSITGLDDAHRLTDVRLERVTVEIAKAAPQQDVSSLLATVEAGYKKAKKHYPSWQQFGPLPASGFYVRDVDGLTMTDVTLKRPAEEHRTPLIVTDSRAVTISGLRAQGCDSAATAIISKRVEGLKTDKVGGLD